ncbi:MAG: class I SAM-dependent methyltransferase [Gammaproteobacteria bacterium]
MPAHSAPNCLNPGLKPGLEPAPRGRDPGLPVPDADARASSDALCASIDQAIEDAGGILRFDRYMEKALYEPGLGYYSGGSANFGPQGDFITAPLVSPLYSRALARQAAQVLAETGGGVLEFGGGTGRLAADALTELDALDSRPDHWTFLDLSGELAARQRETLSTDAPDLAALGRWPGKLPTSFRGCVIANEVLDAMPVRRFRRTETGVEEWGVSGSRGEYRWATLDADDTLCAAVDAIERTRGERLPEGYSSEWNPHIGPWLKALHAAMERGLVLLIDYGYPRSEYYLDQRDSGTLMCHYRQRTHPDPFLWPGLQDITAHVDFTAVGEAALEAGFDVPGYTTQALFLFGNGLEAMVNASDPEDIENHLRLAQQVKTLTLPGEMGERFQVMAIGKGLDLALDGFALGDLRRRL